MSFLNSPRNHHDERVDNASSAGDGLYFELNFLPAEEGGAADLQGIQSLEHLAYALTLTPKTRAMLNVVKRDIKGALEHKHPHYWYRVATFSNDPQVIVWMTIAMAKRIEELKKQEGAQRTPVYAWVFEKLQDLSKKDLFVEECQLGEPVLAPARDNT